MQLCPGHLVNAENLEVRRILSPKEYFGTSDLVFLIILDILTGVSFNQNSVRHQPSERNQKTHHVLDRTSCSRLVQCLHPRHQQLTGRLPHLAVSRPRRMVPTPKGPPEPVLQVRKLGVDLLASRFNNEMYRLVLRYRDPLTEIFNTLVALWDQYSLIYIFPLLKLLLRLPHRITIEGIPVFLIAVNWPRSILFSDLIRLLVDAL